MAEIKQISENPKPVKTISAEAIARSRIDRRRLLADNAPAGKNPFVVPSFPPAVEAAMRERDVPTLAQDQTIDGTYGWAARDYTATAYAEGVVFMGFAYLASLSQRPEYRVVTEVIATEMTREWIELKAASGDESKADKIKRINDVLDNLGVRKGFQKVTESDGFFGRGHLYLDTGVTHDDHELCMDLGDGRNLLSKQKVGSVRSGKSQRLLRVLPVEATWCYPTRYDSVDPLSPDWYNPIQWFVMSREVHRSRLLTFIGRALPDILKPAYAFGGLPMSQLLKPYIDNWLRTRQSVSDLIQNFSVSVLKTNMDATTGVGGDALMQRVQLFNNIKNNQGAMVLDKDAEDFANVSAPLGGLDSLQAQAQEHMASVSRIPLVKLLGIQPAGLNASSEGELVSFEDWIAAFQEVLFRPNLTRVIDFVQLSEFDEVDDDITFDFKPLRQEKPIELDQRQSLIAQTREAYYSMGAVDPGEIREALAQDPDTPFDGVDLDKELPAPPAPPMPAAPAAPGAPPQPGGPPPPPQQPGGGGPRAGGLPRPSSGMPKLPTGKPRLPGARSDEKLQPPGSFGLGLVEAMNGAGKPSFAESFVKTLNRANGTGGARDAFEEAKVKRGEKGSRKGGQFVSKGEGGGASGETPKRESSASPEGGGRKHPGHGYSAGAHLDQNGVVQTDNVNDAIRALYEGRKVALQQPHQVSTLVDKLGAVAQRMEKLGGKAPNFDLCNVSVPGTNLFCAEGKGIPRIQMPQLPDEKGPEFQKYLQDKGVNSEETTEKASFLRATQSELVGVKVSGIMKFFRNKDPATDPPLFVSKDDYIVDGHHRWAARVGLDAEGNQLGKTDLRIVRVDMPILDLLKEADEFTGGKGHKGATAHDRALRRAALDAAWKEVLDADVAQDAVKHDPKTGQFTAGEKARPRSPEEHEAQSRWHEAEAQRHTSAAAKHLERGQRLGISGGGRGLAASAEQEAEKHRIAAEHHWNMAAAKRERGDGGAADSRPFNAAQDAAWKEEEHPRGQPGNPGQFATTSGASKEAEPEAEKPEPAPSAAPKGHLYRLKYRPPGFATLPSGVKWDYAEAPRSDYDLQSRRPDLPVSKHPFGVIRTEEPLTPRELKDFEIEPAEPEAGKPGGEKEPEPGAAGPSGFLSPLVKRRLERDGFTLSHHDPVSEVELYEHDDGTMVTLEPATEGGAFYKWHVHNWDTGGDAEGEDAIALSKALDRIRQEAKEAKEAKERTKRVRPPGQPQFGKFQEAHEKLQKIVDPVGYYSTMLNRAEDTFGETDIILDMRIGDGSEPDILRLYDRRSNLVGADTPVDPETLPPKLKSLWTELNDANVKAAEKVKTLNLFSDKPPLTHEEVKQAADIVTSALDYHPPAGRIQVSDEDRTFLVDGKEHHTAGEAYTRFTGDDKGKIKLYHQYCTPSFIGALMAHETMHCKFQAVLDEYAAEKKRIIEDRRGANTVLHPDDELRDEYKADYPVYAALFPFVQGMEGWSNEVYAKLRNSDGITAYSREWWRATINAKAERRQAYHETLAEIALREWQTGKIEGAPVWRKLYNTVNKLHAGQKKRGYDWFAQSPWRGGEDTRLRWTVPRFKPVPQ